MKRNKKNCTQNKHKRTHTEHVPFVFEKQKIWREHVQFSICAYTVKEFNFFFLNVCFAFFWSRFCEWKKRKKYHKKRSHVLDFTWNISTVFEIWNDIMARPKKLLNEQKKRARDVHQIKHLYHVQLCVCVAANNTIIDNWCCCWCAATSASIDQTHWWQKQKWNTVSHQSFERKEEQRVAKCMEAKKRATKKQRWKAFEKKNHTEMKMQLQEPN